MCNLFFRGVSAYAVLVFCQLLYSHREKLTSLSRKTVQSKLLTKGAFTLLLSQEHSFTVAYKHIINNSFELAPHWRWWWLHTEGIVVVRKKFNEKFKRKISETSYHFQNKKLTLHAHKFRINMMIPKQVCHPYIA